MILTFFLIGLGFLSTPVILRRPGRTIQPQLWTRLCTSSLIVGTVFIMVGGLVSSLATFFTLVGEHRIAKDCELMFGQFTQAYSPISFVALSLVPLSLGLGLRSLARYRRVVRRAWVEPGMGEHINLDNNVESVVIDSTLPRAFSVPRRGLRSSQIVVTTGLLATLSPDQVDVVRAHERAHINFGHGRYLATALVVERMFWLWPPVRLATQELRLAIERSADESSVYQSRQPRSVLQSALVRLALGADSPALASFSSLAGLTHRLDAMDRETATGGSLGSWAAVFLSLTALSTGAFFGLSQIGHGGYCLLSMLHNCALG